MRRICSYNNDYGSVVIVIKKIMDEKHISINTLSMLTKVKYDIVKKYYYNENYGCNLEVLAKFCYILDCNIADIMVYEPAKSLVNQG